MDNKWLLSRNESISICEEPKRAKIKPFPQLKITKINKLNELGEGKK